MGIAQSERASEKSGVCVSDCVLVGKSTRGKAGRCYIQRFNEPPFTLLCVRACNQLGVATHS
jgi:hypothetical protein